MRLNPEAIKEFKEIYYREFSENISDAEAQDMGESLITMFKIIYRPIPIIQAIQIASTNKSSLLSGLISR